MGLTIHCNMADAKQELNRISSRIQSETPGILDECGQRLVGLAKLYFDNLSGGGSGFSGRKWPAMRPSTMKRRQALARRGLLRGDVAAQGVLSGRMRDSIRYEVSGNTLRVRYDDTKAQFFTVHRRLIPTRLPNKWRAACDQIMDGRLDLTDGSGTTPVSLSRSRGNSRGDSLGRPRGLS